MKNVIIGTAGHVDHGKTELIKALSGIDTDRLKEEKKRGITIELGFANLKNDKGLNIGIIDVPGHEKFVKNMLSGVGGIDLVLLIVALDEGVKPQTEEHFKILNNIGIENGIIVFTKKDLINGNPYESIEYKNVNAAVDELVKGSFLENKKRIAVSSFSGDGIEDLKNLIYSVVPRHGLPWRWSSARRLREWSAGGPSSDRESLSPRANKVRPCSRRSGQKARRVRTRRVQ